MKFYKKTFFLFFTFICGTFHFEKTFADTNLREPVTGNSYTFNPFSLKRDPFYPSEGINHKNRNDLLRYDLNEMNLVAILTGMGAPQAMIALPNSKTHIVQVGDPIGRHSGKVSKITSNEVVVLETFRDFQNRIKTNLTNLVLVE